MTVPTAVAVDVESQGDIEIHALAHASPVTYNPTHGDIIVEPAHTPHQPAGREAQLDGRFEQANQRKSPPDAEELHNIASFRAKTVLLLGILTFIVALVLSLEASSIKDSASRRSLSIISTILWILAGLACCGFAVYSVCLAEEDPQNQSSGEYFGEMTESQTERGQALNYMLHE